MNATTKFSEGVPQIYYFSAVTVTANFAVKNHYKT